MSWDKLSMTDRAAYIKLGVENGITDLNTIRSIYNKYAEGGDKGSNSGLMNTIKLGLSELDERVLGRVMESVRNIQNHRNIEAAPPVVSEQARGRMGGTAQRTYLLPRWEQELIFKRDGYIQGKEGDYGLVKKAVGDRDIPIWQTAEDAIDRSKLVPIGNDYMGSELGRPSKEKGLVHAGNYPSTYYVDDQLKNVYVKSWDLNDYGGGTGASSRYKGIDKIGANLLDAVGSPVVVTTGFQNVMTNDLVNGKVIERNRTVNDLLGEVSGLSILLEEAMNKKGLVRTNIGTDNNPDWKYTLPEVTITGKRKRRRGK